MSLSAKLNVRQSVFLPKPPNLMSAKCTTHTVSTFFSSSVEVVGLFNLFNYNCYIVDYFSFLKIPQVAHMHKGWVGGEERVI